MDLLVAHNRAVSYAQRRPMATIALDNKQDLLVALEHGITLDCSEAVVLVFHAAGMKSPTGSYNGYGNTDTMLGHLPHFTDVRQARVGTIIVLSSPDHAVIVRKPGADPVVFSHGSDQGPLFLPLSTERFTHPGPMTLLSIDKLG